MADIRINSLSTTASASSSDDFLALDGATNGTRKLNAYSPTFGGNLTVSGKVIGGNSSDSGAISTLRSSGTATGLANVKASSALTVVDNTTANTDSAMVFGVNGSGAYIQGLYTTVASTITLQPYGGATTLGGNLTVSGTGGVSIGSATFTGGRALTATTGSGNNVGLRLLQTSVADWEIKNVATTGALSFAQSATDYATLTATGNFLLGTNVDAGYKLQVNGTTYLTGFGGSTALTINRDVSNSFGIYQSGGITYLDAFVSQLRLATGSVTALTLDASQNATFAGAVTVSGADKVLTVTSSASTPGFTMRQTGGIAANRNWGIVINNSANGDFILRRSTTTSGDPTTAVLTFDSTGNATFAGSIAIGNTVQTAVSVASTHKVTISIGGSTYYLLATNV